MNGDTALIAGWASIAGVLVGYLAWNGNKLVSLGERLARVETTLVNLAHVIERCERCGNFRIPSDRDMKQ